MHFHHCLDNFKQCTDPDGNTFIAFNMFMGKRLIFAFFCREDTYNTSFGIFLHPGSAQTAHKRKKQIKCQSN